MAIIASKVLWWNRVDEASTYRIRIAPDNAVLDDTSNLSDFNYDVVDQPDTEVEVEVDVRELSVVPIVEGTYDLFITAVDEAGNESDPLLIADALLDFQPPAAPTSGGFR